MGCSTVAVVDGKANEECVHCLAVGVGHSVVQYKYILINRHSEIIVHLSIIDRTSYPESIVQIR